MKSNLKIAIGIRRINTKSGLGKIVLEQIKFCLQNNIFLDIYSHKVDDNIKSLNINVIKIIKIPFIGAYNQRCLFSMMFDLKTKSKKYDLIIGHGDLINQDVMFLHNLVEKTFFLTNGVKLNSSNPVSRFHRKIFKKDTCKLLISNSNLMKSELVSNFGIDVNKITTVYPGYDDNQFNTLDIKNKKINARTLLSLPQNEIIIGFITSGDFKKRNLSMFLDSLNIVKKNNFEFKILLIGKDSQLNEYQNIIKRYNLSDNIIIKPLTDKIENYYYAVDFTVHPAFFEEFGMVVEEAMACGLPVITSEAVGASEIVLNRELIMETPTVIELTKLMELLISNEKIRINLSKLSIESVINRNWKNYIVNSFNLIEQKLVSNAE